MASVVHAQSSAPEKIGAGLLLWCAVQVCYHLRHTEDTCSGVEVLVLLRNSKHNNNTWGLPGGNADRGDGGDLRKTAEREAVEEMSRLPDYSIRGEVLTKRGKRQQKHYTVFICGLESAKEDYVPVLNQEHSQWRWFAVEELRARDDCHPVLHRLLHEHWEEVKPMIFQQDGAVAAAGDT